MADKKVPFLRYQDIQIPDANIKLKFEQAMTSGNFTEGLNLLKTNEQQLKGKAFVVENVGKIVQGLTILENTFFDNTIIFMSDLAKKYNNLVTNFRKKGEWQATTEYNPYEFVVYNSKVYMCIKTTTNNEPPTISEFWLELNIRGLEGEPGMDVIVKYNWSDSVNYAPNDLVIYDGKIYVALKENINVEPTNTEIWDIFMSISKAYIHIGINPPQNPSDDNIWFKTDLDPNNLQTGEAILGEFNRYVENLNQWESMYPNVLFKWIVGSDIYTKEATILSFDILPADWIEKTWKIKDKRIKSNSIVKVYPRENFIKQNFLFSNLFLTISPEQLVLNSMFSPKTKLSIIVFIQ